MGVRVKSRSNTTGWLDGSKLLTGSPFGSIPFLTASLLGLGCVVLDLYLIYRHWTILNPNTFLMLVLVIGVQLVGLWWRVLRYYAKIRSLFSEGASTNVETGEAPVNTALRLSAGGITDILFWSYLLNLALLLLLSNLLFHLDGLR